MSLLEQLTFSNKITTTWTFIKVKLDLEIPRYHNPPVYLGNLGPCDLLPPTFSSSCLQPTLFCSEEFHCGWRHCNYSFQVHVSKRCEIDLQIEKTYRAHLEMT